MNRRTSRAQCSSESLLAQPVEDHGCRLLARLARDRRREIVDARGRRRDVPVGLQACVARELGHRSEDCHRTAAIRDLDGLTRLDSSQELACSLPKLTDADGGYVLFVAHHGRRGAGRGSGKNASFASRTTRSRRDSATGTRPPSSNRASPARPDERTSRKPKSPRKSAGKIVLCTWKRS